MAAAPAQADWTNEVSWTEQCRGINWGEDPGECEREDLHTALGEAKKSMTYPAFNGIAFIKVEEQRAAERQKKIEEEAQLAKLRREANSTLGSGSKTVELSKNQKKSAIPGRWDHAERHKSHRARYLQGQAKRLASMQSLTVHLIARKGSTTEELEQLLSTSSLKQCESEGDILTYRGGISELATLLTALEQLESDDRSRIRCESSDFTLLSKFIKLGLRPLAGAHLSFNANHEYQAPKAPQRRDPYNMSGLCRIKEPMKLAGHIDYGRESTVWLWLQTNNDALLAPLISKPPSRDELKREAGLWTSPHPPTRIYIPPAKPNVVGMGRGASTSSMLPSVPSPPKRSVPSGDIKHFRFKRAIKWEEDKEARALEAKAHLREVREYMKRNMRNRSIRAPSLQAIQRNRTNARKAKQAKTLRKWQRNRILALENVIGSDWIPMDMSSVPDEVLFRCRQIAQHGTHRVYNRRRIKPSLQPSLLKPQTEEKESESKDVVWTEESITAEFNRRMRLLLGTDYETVLTQCPNILKPIAPDTGRGLLHIACDLNKSVQAQVLLSMPSIDVNEIDTNGDSALHIAAKRGAHDIVELILKKCPGVDTTAKNVNGETALHVAAFLGHTDTCKVLLDCSKATFGDFQRSAYDIAHTLHADKKQGTGEHSGKSGLSDCIVKGISTPLHVAAMSGNLEVVKLILEFFSNVEELCIKDLEKKNLDNLNDDNNNGNEKDVDMKLISKAHEAGDEYRVCEKINVNSCAKVADSLHSENELHTSELAPIIQPCIVASVVCCEDSEGKTPLHRAAESGHLNIVKFLTDTVKSMNHQAIVDRTQSGDKQNMTPLMLSVEAGKTNVAKFLWNMFVGHMVNRYRGGPALKIFHIAVRQGNADLVRHFARSISGIENAKAGAACPDMKSNYGSGETFEGREAESMSWTSMHIAAHYGHASTITALAEGGKGDFNSEDESGLRPIDLACMKGHRKAAAAILDAGGIMGESTKSRRAARLWGKARTSMFGQIREGVVEQERLMKHVAKCNEGLIKALETRNAVAIIEATDCYQEAELALRSYRESFLKAQT